MFIIARICRYLRFRILDLVSETKSRNEGALNFRPMPGTLSKARWAKEQSGGMTRGWAVELGGERVRTFFGLGFPKFFIHIELLSLWLVVAFTFAFHLSSLSVAAVAVFVAFGLQRHHSHKASGSGP